MIKKLKTRFIILAMTALTVLLIVIVAGMNIVNYQKVVSDADARITVLSENSDFLLVRSGYPDYMNDDDRDEADDFDDADNAARNLSRPGDLNDEFFGKGGRGGPSMSRDEAEESRFFTVTLDSQGNVLDTNTGRISAVDIDAAQSYAAEAFSTSKKSGFVDEFRYGAVIEGSSTRIIFLDCGRVLESYRNFLRYSIMMSLIGLAIMFCVIAYFAGRIVKPVAESYDKQKRFITDAGHEIKTPLAIIKANIDLMEMDLEGDSVNPAELKDSLGDINDQVNRLTGLTNDLVYLSRMEEADNMLVMSEVPFSDIVTETVSSFEALAAEKGRVICRDIEPMVSIQGSSKELEKLISILMENAIKYSPDPSAAETENNEDGMPVLPEIRVSLKKDGKNAVLKATNMTESELTNESLSHVFERFYRTDGSRNSRTGGHGIGLSMAKAIVNVHGGDITAHTTNGHDFTVTVTL